MNLSLYLKELEDQSLNPPGGDIRMGLCYATVLHLIKSDPKIKSFFEKILKKRALTPSHFVNLLYRAIQYTQLYPIRNYDYPSTFTTTTKWEKELKNLFFTKHDILSDILLHKDTTTTIYQRYAGIKFVLNTLFPSKAVAIADFGCGGNFGIPGLSKNIVFEPIEDFTPQKYVTQQLNVPLIIKEGLSLDKDNPNDPYSRAWRKACSYYPQEFHRMRFTEKLEKKLTSAQNVHFLQKDLLELSISDTKNPLPPHHFDAIIMSTICYQLSYRERVKLLTLAKKSLNPTGYIIIQDFARKSRRSSKSLTFGESWFGKPYSYRTFIAGELTGWNFKEILQWNNGRCTSVKKGADYRFIEAMPSFFPSIPLEPVFNS